MQKVRAKVRDAAKMCAHRDDLSFLKKLKKKGEKWNSLKKDPVTERWLRTSVTLKGDPELAGEQGVLPITWLPVPAGMDSGSLPLTPASHLGALLCSWQ